MSWVGQQGFVHNGSAKLPSTRQGGLLMLAWWFFRSHLACVHLLLLSNCSISISNCICLGRIQVKMVCLLFSLFPWKFFTCSTFSFFTLWFMPQVYLLTPLCSWYPVQDNQGYDRISFCSEMREVTKTAQYVSYPFKKMDCSCTKCHSFASVQAQRNYCFLTREAEEGRRRW